MPFGVPSRRGPVKPTDLRIPPRVLIVPCLHAIRHHRPFGAAAATVTQKGFAMLQVILGIVGVLFVLDMSGVAFRWVTNRLAK